MSTYQKSLSEKKKNIIILAGTFPIQSNVQKEDGSLLWDDEINWEGTKFRLKVYRDFKAAGRNILVDIVDNKKVNLIEVVPPISSLEKQNVFIKNLREDFNKDDFELKEIVLEARQKESLSDKLKQCFNADILTSEQTKLFEVILSEKGFTSKAESESRSDFKAITTISNINEISKLEEVFKKEILGKPRNQDILEVILLEEHKKSLQNKKNRITIKDICAKTGYDQSTVNNALNDLTEIVLYNDIDNSVTINDAVTLNSIIDMYEQFFGYKPILSKEFYSSYDTFFNAKNTPKNREKFLYSHLKNIEGVSEIKAHFIYEDLRLNDKNTSGISRVVVNCRSQWVGCFVFRCGQLSIADVHASLIEYIRTIEMEWKKRNSFVFLIGKISPINNRYNIKEEIEKRIKDSRFPILLVPPVKYFILLTLLSKSTKINNNNTSKEISMAKKMARLLSTCVVGNTMLRIENLIDTINNFRVFR